MTSLILDNKIISVMNRKLLTYIFGEGEVPNLRKTAWNADLKTAGLYSIYYGFLFLEPEKGE